MLSLANTPCRSSSFQFAQEIACLLLRCRQPRIQTTLLWERNHHNWCICISLASRCGRGVSLPTAYHVPLRALMLRAIYFAVIAIVASFVRFVDTAEPVHTLCAPMRGRSFAIQFLLGFLPLSFGMCVLSHIPSLSYYIAEN